MQNIHLNNLKHFIFSLESNTHLKLGFRISHRYGNAVALSTPIYRVQFPNYPVKTSLCSTPLKTAHKVCPGKHFFFYQRLHLSTKYPIITRKRCIRVNFLYDGMNWHRFEFTYHFLTRSSLVVASSTLLGHIVTFTLSISGTLLSSASSLPPFNKQMPFHQVGT